MQFIYSDNTDSPGVYILWHDKNISYPRWKFFLIFFRLTRTKNRYLWCYATRKKGAFIPFQRNWVVHNKHTHASLSLSNWFVKWTASSRTDVGNFFCMLCRQITIRIQQLADPNHHCNLFSIAYIFYMLLTSKKKWI